MTAPAVVYSLSGREAPPRSNGELVFEEPWQARAFGLAVGLVQEQGLDWEDFRTRLIDEIGSWERRHGETGGEGWSYYERWLATLERLVVETGLVSAAEIDAKVARLAAEDSHDHDREHEHEEGL